ncbi:MAG: N-acetylmuramoyl-L-alanine amidase [Burkholderiales bacterium]|nr:MAG: N-acetylmuramoyl-L-alanine amidase [Betaproteobacteria bacterium]TAG83577.1 MAG: N-acetylmuramoyl-L-alanine amidase [Burkholderiales bacterium]
MFTQKRWVAICVAAVFATNAHARTFGPARAQAVDMIVLHSTGGPTCDAKTGKPIWVKAGTLEENMRTIEAHPTLGIHYMLDRDGTLRTSIPEAQVAHHVLTYSGRSIAIELINDGDGIDPFPAAQLDALVMLMREIVARYPVQRSGIKRHSDLDHGRMPCDPQRRRKVDPGDAFPFALMVERTFTESR